MNERSCENYLAGAPVFGFCEAGFAEQRRSDRAPQVAQLGHAHVGRAVAANRWGMISALMRSRYVRAEPHPQPAADHHRLDVEHVERGADARAERPHGPVEQAGRQRVALVQRPFPHPAREPVAAPLLHDVEQHRALAALHLAARARLHRGAAGVGLHAAAAPARAAPPVLAHDHVADLGGGAAPGPRRAVEHDAAPDACAPEDAEERAVLPARAERELGVGRDLHVVADVARARPAPRSARRQAESPVPGPGRFTAAVTVPACSSTAPGQPTPTPCRSAGSSSAFASASRIAPASSAITLRGRATSGSARRASPSTLPRALTTAACIFVPPTSMPPAAPSLMPTAPA